MRASGVADGLVSIAALSKISRVERGSAAKLLHGGGRFLVEGRLPGDLVIVIHAIDDRRPSFP